MIVVGDVGVFHSEIVDDKSKRDGSGYVSKQHGGGGLEVPVGFEVGDEAKLGKEPGLGQAGNTLLDVGKNVGLTSPIMFDEVKKAQFYEERVGVVLEGDPKRGAMLLWDVGAIIEVLNVESAEARSFRHHAVKKHLNERHTGSGGGATVRDCYSIAPSCPPYAPFNIGGIYN